MNILVIGQNTKIANVFSTFADKVYIVADSSSNKKKFAITRQYKENANFIVIETDTDITNIKNIPIRADEIKKWVRNNLIDVVFTNEKNSMIAAKLASLFLKKKPLLLSTSHDSRSWTNKRKVQIFTQIIRATTDGYIALAGFVHKAIVKYGLPTTKAIHLPNTVESELIEKKHNYAVDPAEVKLGYTAVVYRGKGQDTIIKALRIINRTSVRAHIYFMGDILDQEYHTELLNLARDLSVEDQVHFCGRVDNADIRHLLKTYDIYVCPSHMEMSPYNILEAQSAGLPIIATNVGGIPDIITDGYDGFLVGRDDADAFASKINTLISNDDLRTSLGKHALEFSQHNTAYTTGIKLKSFIESLL